MKNAFRVGERVYLDPLELEDLPLLQGWVNDPEVHQFLAAYRPMNAIREREWLEGLGKNEQEFVFGIALRQEEQLIGCCGLHRVNLPNRSAHVGILLGEVSTWGHGYGTEAMNLLLGYGFNTLNLIRVELRVYANNPRAIRCYEKCGFVQEGVLREARFWNGNYLNVLVMGLLRREWRGS